MGEIAEMKKMIIVRENGKKLKKTKTEKLHTGHAEQAAAAQDPNEDPIPIFASPSDFESKKKPGKNNKFSHFKPILIAILSAIGIGSILGFVMIRLFVGIDSELTAQGSNALPIVDPDDNKSVETDQLVLEPIDAFVLQAGVFSDQANAEAWNEKFAEAGLASMIWEKDDQYYLLTGLANEKESAKEMLAELKEAGDFDIFVKEWSTDQAELELSQPEAEWFQSFRDQWTKALAKVDSQEALSTGDWEDLAANYPKEANQDVPLIDAISDVEKEETVDPQITLLNLWHAYDRSLQ